MPFGSEQVNLSCSDPNSLHYIDVEGPSAPSKRTARKRIGGFKFKAFNFASHMGGKPSRVLEVGYKIGRNAGPGQGYFLFRLDYMDFQTVPPTFEPRIHVKYDGVNINHGIP